MEGRRQGETAWESAGGVLQGSSRSSAHTDGCAHLEDEVPKSFAPCLRFRPIWASRLRSSSRWIRRLKETCVRFSVCGHVGKVLVHRGKH